MIHFVTEISSATGSGHLKRMVSLARSMRLTASSCRFVVRVGLKGFDLSTVPFPSAALDGWNTLGAALGPAGPRDAVFVDVRFLVPAVIAGLKSVGNPVYYDLRKAVPGLRGLVINPVPCPGLGRLPPGTFLHTGREFLIVDPDSAGKGVKPAGGRRKRLSILVTFGGTDPRRLTLRILPFLRSLAEYDFTLVLPMDRDVAERAEKTVKPGHIVLKRFGPGFGAEAAKADLVLTPFSTTLYEVLAMARPAVCVNPTWYHQGLMAHFQDLGIPAVHYSRFSAAWFRKAVSRAMVPNPGRDRFGRSLGGAGEAVRCLIASYLKRPGGPYRIPETLCPVCGTPGQETLVARLDKSLFRCPKCSASRLVAGERDGLKSYDSGYFNGDYRAQYGRSYLEDRPALTGLARSRLEVIVSLLKSRTAGAKILDLGCAYGFFLDEARKMGFETRGVEIIPAAVSYARKKLGLDVIRRNLSGYMPKPGWDAVTLWYVLEHLPDVPGFLAGVARSLNPRGILGLSLPNGNGFSFRFRRQVWLAQRPDDHYLDLTVKSARLLAGRFGLRLVKVVNTGIHFSRLQSVFPPWLIPPDTAFFRQLFSVFSRFFNLGDTLELYFRKERPPVRRSR